MNAADPLMIARLGLALLDRFGTGAMPGAGRVMLVTSARAGEGRSFVARLLHGSLSRQHSGAGGVQLSDAYLQPSRPAQSLAFNSEAAAALFRPAAVQQSLAALRERHAITVVDGPPLAQCGALIQQADAVLLVVDARHTPRRQVLGAMADAGFTPQRLAGVVLNQREAGLPRWLGGA